MNTRFYVVFDQSGAQRLTKKYVPSTYRHEVAVGFNVSIPDSVFKTPIINANVEVPEDRVILPDTIDVEVEADEAEQ